MKQIAMAALLLGLLYWFAKSQGWIPPARPGSYEGEKVRIRQEGTLWEGWRWENGQWVKRVGT
jgi:hypothetical protein